VSWKEIVFHERKEEEYSILSGEKPRNSGSDACSLFNRVNLRQSSKSQSWAIQSHIACCEELVKAIIRRVTST
jgi:hypothetical protein